MGDVLIEQLLAEVRRRDRGHRLFGAAGHQYRSQRVGTAQLDAFEDRLGVRLPEAYRTFLLETGCGAGPYYGLWSPAQSWEELGYWRDILADNELPAASPAAPFPLEPPPDPNAGPTEARYPCDGAIPISHQGCTFWSLLITAGPAAGMVWDVASYVEPDGEYLPARRPPGSVTPTVPLPPLPSPPTFLDWYRGWLERCAADLGSSR